MIQTPSITARVYGGLGNQCFIYATARAMADRVQGSLIIDPTLLVWDKVYDRPYLLPEFRVRITRTVDKMAFWKPYLRRIHARVHSGLPWDGNRWLFERTPSSFQPEVFNWQGARTTIDGYWQSERYFEDDLDAIAADLTPRQARKMEATETANRIATQEHAVSLHVRSYREVPGRQDGSWALSASYFRNAMVRIRSQVPTAHFFLFSDDLDWACYRLALPPDIPCTQVRNDGGTASPLADFHLMSLCRHSIVANSSFSWWAAWLGEQRNRSQKRPGLILRPLGHCTNADYYPERWHGVERS